MTLPVAAPRAANRLEGSGARVVVRAPLDLAWAHRQQGLRSIERLNLALFIDA